MSGRRNIFPRERKARLREMMKANFFENVRSSNLIIDQTRQNSLKLEKFPYVKIHMASSLNLNCWVLGDDSTRIFPVQIDLDKNVGGLKEAIKMNPAFDHITANSLDVWNVSIPIDEDTNLQ